MQKKKEIVREKIIEAAAEEFCCKGYLHASIRTIAKRAGISAANMYNYFGNKDYLFDAVLKPVISDIEKGKRYLESPRAVEEIFDLEDHLEMISYVSNYVQRNRELFKLLFFKSFGSEYENYVDDLSEWYTDLTAGFLPWMASQMNVDNVNVDRFVLHNISGIWIQFFREILMHDITGDEYFESAREFMTFSYKGWKGLFKCKTLR